MLAYIILCLLKLTNIMATANRTKDYYKGYTRIQLACIASEFDISFFSVIRWIDNNKNTDDERFKEALKKAEILDSYYYNN